MFQVTATYSFWWYELCDVYLELLKPRLANKDVSEGGSAELSNEEKRDQRTAREVL